MWRALFALFKIWDLILGQGEATPGFKQTYIYKFNIYILGKSDLKRDNALLLVGSVDKKYSWN